MKEIKPGPVKSGAVSLPGSKSYTHRYLAAAALSDGKCRICNCLESTDTCLTLGALQKMGALCEKGKGFTDIKGTGGRLLPVDTMIDLGNSGTSMRLLAGVCALGQGEYVLTGSERMKERPIAHLLEALENMGVEAFSHKGNGCPPVSIKGSGSGSGPAGGSVSIDCSISSQYLSSLLLIGPYTRKGLEINVKKGPVSKPYIDMTLDVMRRFGIQVQRSGYSSFYVPGGSRYRAGEYKVEPDASQAGYFWAAAAVTGSRITVKGISGSSLQGDAGFANILGSMGCSVEESEEGISVSGPGAGALKGVSADMGDMPDMVPTLAVAAAFARGKTVISNVGRLRAKESDRLAAAARELSKMGIYSEIREDSLVIKGGAPHGAEIETYNDHRIAMSFAVAGLAVPGVFIKNEQCVSKSFPGFWDVFEQLCM